MRIISLLPSATEIVAALNLTDQLVGITHECDFPAEVVGLPVVTRTRLSASSSSADIDEQVRNQLADSEALYTLDESAVADLRPDLIVTQTLCDVCAVSDRAVGAAIERLPQRPEVLYLEPTRFEDVLNDVRTVALAAGVPDRADHVLGRLRQRVSAVQAAVAHRASTPRVAVLEWIDPLFSSGHWTPELVSLAGGEEPLSRAGDRSRTLDVRTVVDAQPEVILLACCGYSVERTLADVPRLLEQLSGHSVPAIDQNRVFAIDGHAFFSRPGPRLVDSLEMLAAALHPECFAGRDGQCAMHVDLAR